MKIINIFHHQEDIIGRSGDSLGKDGFAFFSKKETARAGHRRGFELPSHTSKIFIYIVLIFLFIISRY